MARRRYEDDGYLTDDSTLVNSRTSRRRGDRYRSHSEDPYSRPRNSRRHSSYQSQSAHSEKGNSGYGSFAKLALGVVFVEVVATCLSVWMKKKTEEREQIRRREKRRQFEKAKAKRRRDEDRWERQQEERERTEADRWDVEEVHEIRRIGYAPPDDAEEESRSESRPPRNIEPPPDWDDVEQDDRWAEERRNRQRHGRSRSRPAVDVS